MAATGSARLDAGARPLHGAQGEPGADREDGGAGPDAVALRRRDEAGRLQKHDDRRDEPDGANEPEMRGLLRARFEEPAVRPLAHDGTVEADEDDPGKQRRRRQQQDHRHGAGLVTHDDGEQATDDRAQGDDCRGVPDVVAADPVRHEHKRPPLSASQATTAAAALAARLSNVQRRRGGGRAGGTGAAGASPATRPRPAPRLHLSPMMHPPASSVYRRSRPSPGATVGACPGRADRSSGFSLPRSSSPAARAARRSRSARCR